MEGDRVVTMQIGRVGLDSLTIPETMEWREAADGTVEVGGILANASTSEVSHLRDQLLGMIGSVDEPYVPVTLSHDSTRNGFYAVVDGDVDHILGVTEIGGQRRWRARLMRSAWWDQPRYELHREGGVLTNAHSITTASYVGFFALPSSSEAVDHGSDTGTLTRTTRTSETGGVAFCLGSGTGTALYDTVVSADVPLADYYDGAAKVEIDPGGGTDRVVTGRRVRKTDCTDWRLTNGLIEATWNTTNHGVDLRIYNGSAWEAIAPTFILTDDSSSTTVDEDPISWTVLRNDPSMVTIRLVFDYESGTSRYLWDLSVRRGDRNIINVVKSRVSAQWGLEQSGGAYPVTDLTGGYHVTADDANGNRWIIASPKAYTRNASVGVCYLSSASQVFPFGLGVELNGSAATGQSAADKVVYQYYAQPIETPAVSGI